MQILPISQYSFSHSLLKYVTLICLLGYLFIGLPMQANAEEKLSLSIEPSSLQIRATPPADVIAPFTIENQLKEPMTFLIQIQTINVNSDGQISLQTDKTASMSSGLTVEILDDTTDIRELTLAPRQKKLLTIHIPVAKETALKDHYFTVTFLTKTQANLPEGSTASSIQAGIALPVLLAIESKQSDTVSITEFSTSFLLEKGPVPFTLKVENHGEHFVTSTGAIFIKNMFGQTVGKITIPEMNMLAYTTQEVPKIIWEEKLLIGLYSADLNFLVSKNGPLYHRTIYFLALPIKQTLGIIIGTFILFFLFIRFKTLLSKE